MIILYIYVAQPLDNTTLLASHYALLKDWRRGAPSRLVEGGAYGFRSRQGTGIFFIQFIKNEKIAVGISNITLIT